MAVIIKQPVPQTVVNPAVGIPVPEGTSVVPTPAPQQATQVIAPVQDWKQAAAHLAKVREQVMLHAGQEGCNPYLWIAQKVKPLEDAVAAQSAGSKNDELYDSVFSLPLNAVPYIKDLKGAYYKPS